MLILWYAVIAAANAYCLEVIDKIYKAHKSNTIVIDDDEVLSSPPGITLANSASSVANSIANSVTPFDSGSMVYIKYIPKASGRSSTVRVPYIATSGVDTNHSSYRKAMNFINKTNPIEADQVAEFSASTIPRKRRYGAKRLVFNATYPLQQGSYSFPIWFSTGRLAPSGADTRTLAQKINDAGNAIRPSGPVSDEALLQDEVVTRNQLHVNAHTLAYALRVYEFTQHEHEYLLKLIASRQLTVREAVNNLPHVSNVFSSMSILMSY